MARTLELRGHPHRDGLAWVVDHGGDYGTILPTPPNAPLTEALRDASHYGARLGWDGVSTAVCGTCHESWDDALVSSITPAPSARCPFEHEHGGE